MAAGNLGLIIDLARIGDPGDARLDEIWKAQLDLNSQFSRRPLFVLAAVDLAADEYASESVALAEIVKVEYVERVLADVEPAAALNDRPGVHESLADLVLVATALQVLVEPLVCDDLRRSRRGLDLRLANPLRLYRRTYLLFHLTISLAISA